ncbi:MAG TPA: hypothetical protein ENF22_06245 [Chloroflexi bacterium]|nr:hypothetical protein [Chloroflexota bacterium]
MKRLTSKFHLLLILAPLILFTPLIFTGKALVWGTVSTQFVPWWDFAWETLLQGRIPLWNPWVGMGAPLVANYQSAIFYPPYWILLFVYGLAGLKWMSWSLTFVVVFHLIWSGLGTAKLLEEMELGKLAQTVGGLAFSLSGYLVARAGFLSINAAAAWLPWILLFGLRVIRKKKYAVILLSTIMAFQLLAGHAQTTWYSILLGGIWILYWSINNSEANNWARSIWRSISKYAVAGLLAAGISAIQLIPTAEYLLQSQRSVEFGYAEAMTYSFWPWRFLTLFVPNLFGNPSAGNYWGYGNYWEDAVYIGLLPVLIALGAVIRGLLGISKKGSSETSTNNRGLVIFLSGIVFVSFLLALGDNAFLFPFLYQNVPTFGFFQAPTRLSLWAEIALAVLAGIGVEQLTTPVGKRKYWTRLAAAGCIAIIGGALLGWIFLPDVKTTFFIPIGLAGILGLGTTLLILYQPDREQERKFNAWSNLLIMLVAADLIIAGWGLNPGVKIDFYQLKRNEKSETRTFLPEDLEYDLKFNKYFKFNSFTVDGPWEDMHKDLLPNLPILQRIEMVNNFDPLVPTRFQTWIAEYNGLAERDQHQMTGLMNIGQFVSESGGQVITTGHEIKEPISEIRINDLIEISQDDQKILDQILDQSAKFSESMILISSPTAVNANCISGGDGEVWINEKAPGYIKIQTDLNKNSWLIWSQSWYPGWVAVIDGEQQVEVERANYLFQAVCVPEGEHIVEISYKPVSFYMGAGITGTSLVLLITIVIFSKKKTKSN